MQHRDRRSADTSLGERTRAVDARPGLVAERITPLGPVSEPRQPPAHTEDSSDADAAVSAQVVIGEPRSVPPSKVGRRSYSFIAGSLIGISMFLPVFALDAGEGGSALVLLVSLSLTAAGIAMHLRSGSETNAP